MAITARQFLAPGEALAGENEAVLGSNRTSVNAFFNAPGSAYCGFTLWYCDKKSGAGIFNGCANPAYVPTFKDFCRKHMTIVPSDQAQEGDLCAYLDQHVFAIKERVSGTTVITFEGNSTVYKTIAEAKASSAGSGKYEGIGYKKRVLNSSYTVYRPNFAGTASAAATDSAQGHVNKTGASCSVTLALCKIGSSGPMVKTFQRICYAYGIKGADGKIIAVDGEFGTNSAFAAKQIQKMLGLTQDGQVGKDTWTAMLTRLW